jgi:hypothetical protein
MRKTLNSLLLFGLKIFIVLFLITSFIPPTDHIFKNYRVKYFMVSLIDNPNILYELSKRDEKKKNYESSIRYMNGAIGILEKNNVSNDVMEKYTSELNRLRKISTNK